MGTLKLQPDLLSVKEIKYALDLNSKALIRALNEGSFQKIKELKTQRDELKNTLIEILEFYVK